MYDRQETLRRGYKDPRSKVYFDSRERLYGKDWKERKYEVWQRGWGRCEHISEIDGKRLRCPQKMHDPHHIIERGRRRDDRISNLIGLCRLHHELMHEKRRPRFGEASQLRSKRLLGLA
jgi:hypothetical protein